jgi:hypothetical protein
MNKYEQLIEHIINDDESKARALFHQIVIERSREIYESLMDEEQPSVSNNAVGNLEHEVEMDETGMHEEDEELGMPGDDMGGEPDADNMGGPSDMDADNMGADMGGDSSAPATKDDIMDLESAIDELKAEFDRLMSNDSGADEMDSDDMDSDEEGEEGDDEEGDEESGKNPFASADDEEEADDEEPVAESRAKRDNRTMTEAERIREYVEKVGTDWDKGAYKGPKGENVGTGNKSENQGEKNTKSPVAGKNDMGGTSANMMRQASEADPSGTSPKGKAGGFLKSPQEIDVAKRNVNKPGGNKGAQNYFDSKASAKTGEQGVNANSPLNGAPGRAK